MPTVCTDRNELMMSANGRRPAIEVDGLTKVYPGGIEAARLCGVSRAEIGRGRPRPQPGSG
jgi:hypothetical protein